MLTRTIVQVGHDLGIEIVAEGIERPEQLELLRAMGCGLGQGYLVARPMPAGAIESMAPESMAPESAAAHRGALGDAARGAPGPDGVEPSDGSGPNMDENAPAAAS